MVENYIPMRWSEIIFQQDGRKRSSCILDACLEQVLGEFGRVSGGVVLGWVLAFLMGFLATDFTTETVSAAVGMLGG